MAFERIGLGAVLTFAEQSATAAMGRARAGVEAITSAAHRVPPALTAISSAAGRVFNMMSTGAAKVAGGMSKMQGGFMSASIGLAPLTLGMATGAKMFIDFEKQMSTVESVVTIAGATMQEMEVHAKKLGATTAFTATEASQGMEVLARAGFTSAETIDATGHALNLAAADSIELATAGDIMAQVLRGMNIEAADSQRVADVLAKTSASTNSNVISLGESFKMGSATAMQMDISLEETAAIMGTMSDAGLRGTLAGTSFTNMMLQLSKPSQKAQDLMKKLNIEMVRYVDETTGAIKIDFPASIVSISQGLQKIKDPLDRAGASAELFGIRGQKAANAFAVAGATKLAGLTESLENASGHAQKMADTRLNNFAGQVTLLTSAIEGFAIEFFEGVMNPMTDLLKAEVIPGVMNLVGAFQAVNTALTSDDIEKAKETYGETTVAIIQGLADGIKAVKEAFQFIIDKVKEWGQAIDERFGEGQIREIMKWVTVFALVAGAAIPIILAMMALGFVISGLISIVSGAAAILSGAFLPVLAIVAALAVAFLAVRAENESFGDTVSRVWANIKAWALDVWENVLKPFWQGIKDGYELHWPMLRDSVTEAFGVIKEAIAHVYGIFAGETPQVATDWRMAGTQIIGILAGIIETIATTIKWIVLIGTTIIRVGRQYFLAVMDTFLSPFVEVYNLIADVIAAIGLFASGDITGGLKKFGMAIINFMLAPLRFVLRQIIRLADVIDESLVPQNIRDFMNEGVMSLQEVDYAEVDTSGTRGAPVFLEKKEAVMDANGELTDAQRKFRDDTWDAITGSITDGMASLMGEQTAVIAGAVSEKPCIDNTVDVNLDGERVARNQQRHKQEIQDRAGFKTTPYQRRVAAEHGAVPRK